MSLEELRQAVIDQNQAILDNDIKMKAKGFTHRVTYVIHPRAGGSDEKADCYFGGDPRTLTLAHDKHGAWKQWQEIKAMSSDYIIVEL